MQALVFGFKNLFCLPKRRLGQSWRLQSDKQQLRVPRKRVNPVSTKQLVLVGYGLPSGATFYIRYRLLCPKARRADGVRVGGHRNYLAPAL